MKWFLLAAIVLGVAAWYCTYPGKVTKAKSQVEVIARKSLASDTFNNDGTTNETDPWGHQVTWELTEGIYNHIILVRSSGPDGLPYTWDDIIGRMYVPKVKENANPSDPISERISRAITRGAVKGVREGLKRE